MWYEFGYGIRAQLQVHTHIHTYIHTKCTCLAGQLANRSKVVRTYIQRCTGCDILDRNVYKVPVVVQTYIHTYRDVARVNVRNACECVTIACLTNGWLLICRHTKRCVKCIHTQCDVLKVYTCCPCILGVTQS